MDDLERINIADHSFSDSTEVIRFIKENPEGFILEIPVCGAQSHMDVALYYLEAAYVGQELMKYAARLDYNFDEDRSPDSIAELTLKAIHAESLGEAIYHFMVVWTQDDEEEYIDFRESMEEYQDNLEDIDHAFPELVDGYYANHVNGVYPELDPEESDEFFEEEFSRFPERSYGFVKPALSGKIGQEFYSSLDSLIIPTESNLNLVIKEYLGIENLDFIKADFFAIGNISYLICDGQLYHFPFGEFLQAKECGKVILNKENESKRLDHLQPGNLLTYNRGIADFYEYENMKGYPIDRSEEFIQAGKYYPEAPGPPDISCFYVSAFGDYILIKDIKYACLFFTTDRLRSDELNFLSDRLSILFATTARLAGILPDIQCPWGEIDGEIFEELCYDIIYLNPKYDNSTIRKMGKLRSRDGGRDIEIYTRPRPGESPKKFIFQCKYMKPGSSLTASRVQNISDTIDQYSAAGYGIMTNVTVDATLYDRLDGIAAAKKTEMDHYAVYRLERILARYPQLKSRHFRKTQ